MRVRRARGPRPRDEEVARAGERVSVNLAGVELSDLRAGNACSRRPSRVRDLARLIARLDLLPSAPPVRRAAIACRFHHFSVGGDGRRAAARRARSPGRRLRPRGSCGLASPIAVGAGRPLRGAPALAGRDDRRRRRARSAGPAAVRRPRRRGARELLDRLESGSLGERLVLWIEEAREHGGSPKRSSRSAPGSPPAEVSRRLSPALARRGPGPRPAPIARPIRGRNASLARAGRDGATSELQTLVDAGPTSVGVPRGTLLHTLLPGADPRWAEAIEAALVAARRVRDRRRRGARARAATTSPARTASSPSGSRTSSGSAASIRPRPPRWHGDRPAPPEGRRGPDRLSGEEGRRSSGCRAAGSSRATPSTPWSARLRASGKTAVDVAEFKEMFGLTRRLAIPLLEHLDARR